MMNALLNRYKRRPAVGSNIGTTGSKNSSSNTGNTKSADSVAPVGNIFTKFRFVFSCSASIILGSLNQ